MCRRHLHTSRFELGEPYFGPGIFQFRATYFRLFFLDSLFKGFKGFFVIFL
jgi:hypothetical protein